MRHLITSPRQTVATALLFGLLLVLLTPSLATAQEGADDSGEASAGEQASSKETASTAEDSGAGSLRRSNRMEFDARLVRGETAGSGAVFLFQRAPRVLPSMVARRRSYLQDSVDAVLTPAWSEERDASNRAQTSTATTTREGGSQVLTPASSSSEEDVGKKTSTQKTPPKKRPVRKKR